MADNGGPRDRPICCAAGNHGFPRPSTNVRLPLGAAVAEADSAPLHAWVRTPPAAPIHKVVVYSCLRREAFLRSECIVCLWAMASSRNCESTREKYSQPFDGVRHDLESTVHWRVARVVPLNVGHLGVD